MILPDTGVVFILCPYICVCIYICPVLTIGYVQKVGHILISVDKHRVGKTVLFVVALLLFYSLWCCNFNVV